MSYYYKSAHLARVLRYCKNDQILESCYQQQEKMLRQEKYKDIANKYDLRHQIFLINSAYVTSIFKKNVKEEK